jgi:CheY-like chemotaxis protein
MPVMGGIEATRQIRKHLKLDIPIIALTANAVKGESERCTEAGMSAYVSKPFEESELVNTMISCLDIKSSAAAGTALPLTPSENEELPLFNLQKLEKLGEGDPAFIHKMIQLFLTQVPATVKAMQEAMEKGDYETVRALAHKLKPAINNMDIHSLKTVVRDIEITAEKEPGNETLPEWVATLAEIITRVTTELQTRFSLPC